MNIFGAIKFLQKFMFTVSEQQFIIIWQT